LGSLRRRLSRLEEDSRWAEVVREREARREWVRSCEDLHAETTPQDALSARAAIRRLRQDGRLQEMDSAELVELIASQGTLSPNIVRLEVMRAIHNREPSMLHMKLPSEWCEAFEAGAQLRRLSGAMPPETAALCIAERASLGRREGGATEEELKQLDTRYLEPHGITEELEERAVGPDADQISEAEKKWRISEHVHAVFISSWGWEVHKHASRLKD
jgi:hypothetical protein